MSEKREKSACASMGHLQKLKNIKNGGLREWRGRESGWLPLRITKMSLLPLRITKMPLLGHKCCPFTQMTWK